MKINALGKESILLNEKNSGSLILLYQFLKQESLNGKINVSHNKLSIELKVSRPTIKKYLQILEEYKLITNSYNTIIIGE